MTTAQNFGLVLAVALSAMLPSSPAAGGGLCWGGATHPNPPTNLRHEWDACGNRYLAWDPVPGAIGYGVCRFPCGMNCTPTGEYLAVSGTTALDPGAPACPGCCSFSGVAYEVYAFFPDLEYPTDRSCAGITLALSGAVPTDQQRVTPLPIDPLVCAGSSTVEFRAQVVTNAPANGFTYEWKRNGETVATSNAPSLTVPVVSADDGAVYSVRASNGCLSLSAAWPPLDVGDFPPSGPILWTSFQHSMNEYRFRQHLGEMWGPCGESMCGSYQSLSRSSFSRDCPHDQLSSVGASISVEGYLDVSGGGGGNHTCPAITDYRRWERWTGTFTTTRERAVSVRGSVTSMSTQTVVDVFENDNLVRTYAGGPVDEVLLLGPGTIRIDARAIIANWWGYDHVQLDLELLPPADDCNLNDVSDVIDISDSTSPDIDANGTPDECQTVRVPGDYGTIQAAIDAAPASEMRIISVAAGTYAGPIAFNGKPVIVRGASAASTVIDGASGQTLSVVRFNGSEPAIAALERVTVRGGITGTPIPSSPTVLAGGGIFGLDSAASVRDCVVEQNASGFGAGAYFLRCTGEVRGCTFRNNNASSDGGGFQSNQGTQQLTDVLIENNVCNSRGAGMHLVQGTPTLTRVTVRNNYSNNLIGGVSWYALGDATAAAMLDACVVTGNSALVTQGGIGISAASTGVPTFSLRASNLCSNTPKPNVSGAWADLGGNSICDCTGDLTLDGNVDGSDMGLLLSSWGFCGATCPHDLNNDGKVNGGDLGLLLSAWGTCGGK